MSINFLDIKYVIIFSLVQYSTAVVLKSPKYYTSIYIKKQSKTNLYIHNPYKARKNNDYNYKDWEEKKQDVYDYLLSSTNHTSTTASNISNETSPQESLYTSSLQLTPTNPILESSQYSAFATYPRLPSTDSTPNTSLPTSSTVSTPLSISSSLSTPYNITTTTLTQEVSTVNVTNVTTTLSSTVTQIDVISLYLKKEIEAARVKLRAGYFTASVYVLLKIIENKKDIHVKSLLEGLELQFDKLNALDSLVMFGPMVTSALTSMVKMMAAAPVELIKLQSKNGQALIENKKELFQADIRSFFDIVDAIYIEEDVRNIVVSLTDIQKFPTPVPMPTIDVAQDAVVAFILIPYARIQRSPKEQVLMREIYNVVQKRMFGEESMRTGPNFRKYVKIKAKMTESSKDINRLKGTTFTKAQFTKGFVGPTLFTEPTTINLSEINYASYVKDPKIRKRFRHKIRTYKYNFRQSRYKMKITTPKTTRFTGNIRKFIYDGNFNRKKENEKSSSDNNNYGADEFKSNRVNSMISIFKMKNNIIQGENSKMEIKDINKIQTSDNKTDSSDSNAEAYLQVNLNDAQFHTHNITIDRRFMKKKVNKLRKMDSFSDDEAILKGNIYKVFGYNNDFAKRLRAML